MSEIEVKAAGVCASMPHCNNLAEKMGLILGIAEGSTTANSLRHIAEIARSALDGIEVGPGWQIVPIEPTPSMLRCLRSTDWPADWEAGKALQLEQYKQGVPLEDSVPMEANTEVCVGKYQRMLKAAPVVAPVTHPKDTTP